MTPHGRNGHSSSGSEAFDDATVEELLSGRYRGQAPDLAALGEFLDRVRAFADQPVPPPSGDLARLLTEPASARGPIVREPGAAQHRWRPRHVVAVAAAASVLLVAAVVAAGSARLLPGPAQDVVAMFVRTVTPFDFPDQRGTGADPSGAPSTERVPPGGGSPAPPLEGPAPEGPGQPPASGSGATGGEPAAGRSRPGGVEPVTPAVPRTGGLPSSGTESSTSPPGARRNSLGAELSGAADDPTAADPDGHGTAVLVAAPRSEELCLTLVVSGTAPVTEAHLHEGSSGVPGPVVAAFVEFPDGPGGACVAAPEEVVRKVRKDPGNYYVDVHTTEFPDGAIRGQLAR